MDRTKGWGIRQAGVTLGFVRGCLHGSACSLRFVEPCQHASFLYMIMILYKGFQGYLAFFFFSFLFFSFLFFFFWLHSWILFPGACQFVRSLNHEPFSSLSPRKLGTVLKRIAILHSFGPLVWDSVNLPFSVHHEPFRLQPAATVLTVWPHASALGF